MGAIDKAADDAAQKLKEQATLNAQGLQTGLGQPRSTGDAGPPGTAPVAGKPIVPNDPTPAVLQALTPGLGQPRSPGDAGPPGTAPVAPNTPTEPQPIEPQIADVKPTTPEIKTVDKVTSPGLKDMVAKVLSGPGKPTTETGSSSFNFGDFLKGAGSKLGDFLQRWGMGLQGAPTGLTQGDIQRQQAFELQKTQVQAQVAAKQMELDNQYQQQRMQLQNQMNLANLPIEAKQQLQNRIAELDAEYQNQLKLIPIQIQQQLAQSRYGMQAAGTNTPSNFWTGGG